MGEGLASTGVLYMGGGSMPLGNLGREEVAI